MAKLSRLILLLACLSIVLIGIVDSAAPLDKTMPGFQTDLLRLLTENESAAQAVVALRNQPFLASDDDSGAGY